MWSQRPPSSELSRVKRTPWPQVRESEFIPSVTSLSSGNTSESWEYQQERVEISNQYSIVPAYNKGPYMVVPVEELHTAGKKV